MSTNISLMCLKSRFYLGAICLAAMLGGTQTQAAAVERTAAEQVATARIFSQPLVWAGTDQANQAQSADLLVSANVFKSMGTDNGIASLEGFLRANPNSGWAPALHTHLGKYYRDRGRYTLAISHWEKAWAETKNAKDANGKALADFTLAHWTRLLASLGQKDQLNEIFLETKDRKLSAIHLNDMFLATKEAHKEMVKEPGKAYMCGTFALHNIYKLSSTNQAKARDFLKIPSPEQGFSLEMLEKIAAKEKMDLVPVYRESGDEIVVPSVIHWKLDHYAAILEKRGNLYKVVDPTFGNSLWIKKAVIDSEASGYFMIPEKEFKNGWRRLAANEMGNVRGKGITPVWVDVTDCCGNSLGGFPVYNGYEGDQNDNGSGPDDGVSPCMKGMPGCPGGKGPNGSSGGNGSANGGWPPVIQLPCVGDEPCADGDTGLPVGDINGGDPNFAVAMPRWQVSQPNINLFLRDTPMLYRTAYGSTVRLSLTYKQRGMMPYETNIFGFGQGWSANLGAYVRATELDSDPNFANYEATVYSGNGSQLTYRFDDSGPSYYNLATFERILDGGGNLTGFKVKNRDGNEEIYGYMVTNGVDEVTAYLTEKKSRRNRSTLYEYTSTNSVLQLSRLIDDSGQTNTFLYKTNAPWLVLKVTNPFGNEVWFSYDTNGYMTNITDVVGISSSFKYDGDGAVTNLTTPYGTTSFKYIKEGFYGTTSEDSTVYRVIEATLPTGAKSAWLYRHLRRIDHPLESPLAPWFVNNVDEAGSYLMTSTFWGPRQYANLSTNDIHYITSNDHLKGSTVIWRGVISEPTSHPSPTPCALRAPSQDGVTEGTKYYLTHPGAYSDQMGTSPLPSGGWFLLPDGTTNSVQYTHNSQGYPTKIVSTYSINGVIGLRTNQYEYAANDIDLVTVTGPTGHVEAGYSYNTNHQVLTYTNAAGYVTTYTYNTNAQTTSITTPAGLTTTNIFDANGWLTKTIDLEIGRTNSYGWTNGLILYHINEYGLAATNTYDAINRLTSTRFPDGTTVSNTYANLDLVSVKDRLNNWTHLEYNSLRRPTVLTNALGYVTRYGYCECGALESITNALGETSTYIYNNANQRTAVIDANNNSIVYTYDTIGRLISITDSIGNSTTNYYNSQGLITSVSNALGRLKQISYSIDDLATNVIDANGTSISMTYDSARRLILKTYPDAGLVRIGYSTNGVTAYTNQLDQVTRYGYDIAGRKTSETNANDDVTTYTYNTTGDLLSITDPNNHTTSWGYDEYGRVTNKVGALTNSLLAYLYDANGRLTNRWSAAKGNTRYAYDAMGNLTNIDYTSSTDIQMQYDALGQLTNMIDAVGATKYAYTTLGQLQSEDGPWADDSVMFTYLANSQRESLSVLSPNGKAWTQNYTYDVGNRIVQINGNAGTFNYVYKSGASSLVQEVLFPGGSKILNTYDDSARMTNTKLINSGLTTLNQHAYVYNIGNQRIKETFTDGNYIDYTYNSIGQIKSAIGYESGGITPRLQEQIGYNYDSSGNLNWRTNNALIQQFNVNALNQLFSSGRSGTYTVAGRVSNGSLPVSVAVNNQSANVYNDLTFAKSGFSLVDGTNVFTAIATDNISQSATNITQAYLPETASFQYDENGNLLSDGQKSFAYDDENQLISVVVTNAWKSEFVYDGKLRRRIRKDFTWNDSAWLKTNETFYVYDCNLVIQERTDANVPAVTYTRGRDLSGTREGAGGIGGLLARTAHPPATHSPSVSAFYHCDANGNITALINAEEAIVGRYHYDPFGNLISKSGILADANLYRFSSKEVHELSGMIYYLYRYYLPVLHRWLNSDPINELGFNVSINSRNPFNVIEESNLYRFVHNNPISFYDADGRVIPIVIGGVVISAEVAAVALAVAAAYGLSVYACLQTPACAKAMQDAISQVLEKAKDICKPKPKTKPNDGCKSLHEACIGSGLPCLDCLWYCNHYGSWPTDKCPESKF